ncbi:MAG: AAA family ATPase [Candidatus Parabeggiatoa sp.]|nr:AAA family ATPase [Candidatus Parabeggiatoa sp.]
MLNTLHAKNFTLFSDATFEFAPGLNVIIGDNGTGKSHLLTLAYTTLYVLQQALREYLHSATSLSEAWWALEPSRKLKNVFKPDNLSHLCHSSVTDAEITLIPYFFGQATPELTLALSVSSTEDKVTILHSPSFESYVQKNQVNNIVLPPLFFPVKEVLSIYPGFIASYEDRELAFDETYYDLCKALSRFVLRGKRRDDIADWVAPLEKLIPGKLILDVNRFYLKLSEQQKREIYLIPEGIRKIAMLNYLILNGSLTKGSTLFWEEPETNLNAKLRVKLVDTLVQLANTGVQIVLTTQDLFLMKELALRVDARETKAHFFELLEEDAEIRVVQGENLDDLSTIVALEVALDQYDRAQDVFYRD